MGDRLVFLSFFRFLPRILFLWILNRLVFLVCFYLVVDWILIILLLLLIWLLNETLVHPKTPWLLRSKPIYWFNNRLWLVWNWTSLTKLRTGRKIVLWQHRVLVWVQRPHVLRLVKPVHREILLAHVVAIWLLAGKSVWGHLVIRHILWVLVLRINQIWLLSWEWIVLLQNFLWCIQLILLETHA